MGTKIKDVPGIFNNTHHDKCYQSTLHKELLNRNKTMAKFYIRDLVNLVTYAFNNQYLFEYWTDFDDEGAENLQSLVSMISPHNHHEATCTDKYFWVKLWFLEFCNIKYLLHEGGKPWSKCEGFSDLFFQLLNIFSDLKKPEDDEYHYFDFAFESFEDDPTKYCSVKICE